MPAWSSVCLFVCPHSSYLYNAVTDQVDIWYACTLGPSLYSACVCEEVKGQGQISFVDSIFKVIVWPVQQLITFIQLIL